MIAAIDENGRRGDRPLTDTIRPLLGWSAAFVFSLFLVYAPLIVPGALDDFLARLRIASYGGSYNGATWTSFTAGLRRVLPAVHPEPCWWRTCPWRSSAPRC